MFEFLVFLPVESSRMVASKVRAVGAFRILDEANESRKEEDSNIQGAECRRARSFALIPKPSRDASERVLMSRKTLPVNAPAKAGPPADIDNGKGKMQSRRKALADIGNLNNKTSQQFSKQRSYKPKLISRKDILEGAKKVKVEESYMPQGWLSTKSIGVPSNKSLLGKMQSRRKALADIGKLNNKTSQRLSYKPKLISQKDILEGAMKVKVEESYMPQGWLTTKSIGVSSNTLLGNSKSSALISGKISLPVGRRTISEENISKETQFDHPTIGSKIRILRTQKVLKNAAAARRPAVTRSKVPRALVATKASNTNRFEPMRHSWNKDLEEHGKSSSHDNAMVLQEHLKADGRNNSNDLMNTTSTSGCKSNRRKSYTLSLVMSGCDILKKDLLPNIDDITNPLEVVQYVEDIYQYYWTMEVERPSVANYTEIQSEVTPKMRSILVNWLIEVHHRYGLMEETLFLMIELLNRLLSIITIKKSEMQMFGLTALLLASKYEDYWHPKVDELISLSVNQYTRNEMLATEWLVLSKLQFRLNVPTPYVFMLRFLKAAQSDKKLEDLAFYLIELCLVENESLKYKPSLLCASAIFVARSNLKLSPPWTKLLSKHAHYEESQLRTCAEMMLRFQREACRKPVKYTYHKYLKPDRSCVASIKPIKMLPP